MSQISTRSSTRSVATIINDNNTPAKLSTRGRGKDEGRGRKRTELAAKRVTPKTVSIKAVKNPKPLSTVVSLPSNTPTESLASYDSDEEDAFRRQQVQLYKEASIQAAKAYDIQAHNAFVDEFLSGYNPKEWASVGYLNYGSSPIFTTLTNPNLISRSVSIKSEPKNPKAGDKRKRNSNDYDKGPSSKRAKSAKHRVAKSSWKGSGLLLKVKASKSSTSKAIDQKSALKKESSSCLKEKKLVSPHSERSVSFDSWVEVNHFVKGSSPKSNPLTATPASPKSPPEMKRSKIASKKFNAPNKKSSKKKASSNKGTIIKAKKNTLKTLTDVRRSARATRKASNSAPVVLKIEESSNQFQHSPSSSHSSPSRLAIPTYATWNAKVSRPNLKLIIPDEKPVRLYHSVPPAYSNSPADQLLAEDKHAASNSKTKTNLSKSSKNARGKVDAKSAPVVAPKVSKTLRSPSLQAPPRHENKVRSLSEPNARPKSPKRSARSLTGERKENISQEKNRRTTGWFGFNWW